MITPYASFKATNTSQPDGLGGNKVWGGCLSCHVADAASGIESNYYNHHKEINGFARYGGKTVFQNASTPFNLTGAPGGRSCFVCHVVASSGSPLRFNVTNPFTGELLISAMELRNSTIEAASLIEPGTTNITFNGTGCEKCHGVQSIHNIQYNYAQNGQQGLGHINNDKDCEGCHNSWLPATDFVPGALVPYVDTVSPAVIAVNTATTLTITGSNFVNGEYTSVVKIDGGAPLTPTSITDTEIVVDIPVLSAGTHQLQIVKGGDTLSKLTTLLVAPNPNIVTAKLNKGIITITGTGFGTKPATNAVYYISVDHAGNQLRAKNINGWSNTQIKASMQSGTVSKGDWVTVITKDAGEVKAQIT
jgi:hypothetical protein